MGGDIRLQKKILNFQQQTDGAEFCKRLSDQYNDIEAKSGSCPYGSKVMAKLLGVHQLSMADYYINYEDNIKAIKKCNADYKDYFAAKMSITNCKSTKLCDDLSKNKMFGINDHPVSTAETSSMIIKYNPLDLELGRKSKNERASDKKEDANDDDNTNQVTMAISTQSVDENAADEDATVQSNTHSEDNEEVNTEETDHSQDNGNSVVSVNTEVVRTINMISSLFGL